jgi:hypothetical protein
MKQFFGATMTPPKGEDQEQFSPNSPRDVVKRMDDEQAAWEVFIAIGHLRTGVRGGAAGAERHR